MRNLTAGLLKTGFFTAVLLSLGLPIAFQSQAAIASDVYKIELKESPEAQAYTLKGEALKKVRGQSEWAVLTVSEPNVVQFKHMRRLAKSYGVSTWSENPVTTVIACPITTGSCQTISGGRFEIPKANTIKDFRFEFQFVEGKVDQVRLVQVPSDRIPETQVKPTNSRSRSNRK
jgi:hypothetical protein